MSSLDDPRGSCLGLLPTRPRPSSLTDRGDEAGRPMRLRSRRLGPVEVKRPGVDPVSRDQPLIDHMQRESVDPRMALDDEDMERDDLNDIMFEAILFSISSMVCLPFSLPSSFGNFLCNYVANIILKFIHTRQAD